jgi:hypothetical protein
VSEFRKQPKGHAFHLGRHGLFYSKPTNMKTSVMDQLKAKESRNESQEQAENQTQVAEAEMSEQQEFTGEEAEEIEEPVESKISEEARKQLSEKSSFMEKLKMAGQSKEEAQLEPETELEEEVEEEEIEATAEEQEAEEVKAQPFELEVDGKKFDSIEAVKAHLNEVAEERQTLQKEVDEIRAFVDKVSDPELLEALSYVAKGYSFRVAMVKAGMDESIFNVDTDDEDAEDLVRAKIERKQAAENHAKEQEKLRKNMEESNKALQEFQAQEGFDEKVKNDLVGLMTRIHSELLNGLVTKETLSIFTKALNYEKVVKKAEEDVKTAKEVGKIQGMNEKIAVERKRKQGDGIPQLGRGINATEVRKPTSDLARHVSVPANSFMEKVRARQESR